MYKRVWIIVIVAGVFGAGFMISRYQDTNDLDPLPSAQDTPRQIIEARYFDPQLFYESLNYIAPAESIEVAGGIVPHHLLAGRLISDFFQRVSNTHYETIIILGPNHKNAGTSPVIVSDSFWQTPLGLISPQSHAIEQIGTLPFVAYDDAIMQAEHAVTGIFPYVVHFMPETKVVPVIISASLAESEREMLESTLREIIDTEKTLLVAAVDFSHYLSSDMADQKDAETTESLIAFDADTFLTYTNDHVDAPQVMAMLINIMEAQGKHSLRIIENTNSARMTGVDAPDVTSYFEVIYF